MTVAYAVGDLSETLAETADFLRTANRADIDRVFNESMEATDCTYGDFAAFLMLALMRNDSPAAMAGRYDISLDSATWIHSAMMVALFGLMEEDPTDVPSTGGSPK
jgi:anthranilate phosphoribosyltransferase